jgi:hypothetical protein
MKKHILLKRERKPTKFDALSVFAAWGQDEHLAITHKDAVSRFARFLEQSLNESLQSDTLLYGNRTQALFEAVVANLGAVQLVKSEDNGDIYNADSTLEIPDTRIVLADGRNLLVETKNHHRALNKPYRMKEWCLNGLTRYAKLVGCELRIAIFWSMLQQWTLIPPSALVPDGKSLQITFPDAFMANEMGSLGDKWLGCRFPVTIQAFIDKRGSKPRFLFDKYRYFLGELELTQPSEQPLLRFLMTWGNWDLERNEILEEDDYKQVVNLIFMPREEERRGRADSGSGCVMNEFLSALLSRYWVHLTSNEEGKFKTMLPNRDVWSTRMLELTEETSKFFAVATVISPAEHRASANSAVALDAQELPSGEVD